jgi:cytochrome c1
MRAPPRGLRQLKPGENSLFTGNEARDCPVPIDMGRVQRRDRPWEGPLTVMALIACALLTSCKDPVETRREPTETASDRGFAAIKRAGCGSCHEIPGLDWPSGRLGPSLEGFDDIGLIAGKLPNRPDMLAAFIRNPRSVKPGSTMPPMPVSEAEALDIAAYLYGLDHD